MAGNTATTELTNVKDVTASLSCGEADATTRAAKGWKVTVPTLFEGELTFEMNKLLSDPGYVAIRNAFLTHAAIALAALDSTGDGLDADFSITGFNENQGLEEAVTISVTAKPTYVTRAPTIKTGTSSGTSGSSGT